MSLHALSSAPLQQTVIHDSVRMRFTPAIAARLQRIAWWEWPLEKLMANLADFQSSDIERFCERHG